MFDVVYIKSNSISCEFSGLNIVATLRCTEGIFMTSKLKVDALTVHRRARRLSTLPFVRSFKHK